MMASANVDLVRSIYADTERGNFRSGEWAHSEIEFVMPDGPSPGRWTGLAGMAEGHRDWPSAWEDLRAHGDDFRELAGERVLVLVRYSGHGKTSGLELGQVRAKGACLFHVHDGKVTKIVLYWDHDRALADLGLGPEGDSQ